MPATIIVDAFWGDSGKGKLAAFLAKRLRAKIAVRAGVGTNAGHSVYLKDGRLVKTSQLPLAFLSTKTKVMVGSGVCVDPEIFLKEVATFGLKRRAAIDYRCPIIEKKHKTRERRDSNLSKKIGSTSSGSGHARADFLLRRGKQARDVPALKPYLSDVAKAVNGAAETGEVVVESSQSTYLSLYLSPDYPYVTSDNCTTAAAIDDVGLNWQKVKRVVLVVKAVPSRVGKGPLPFEISRKEILKKGLVERGVVTGRLRRKAAKIDFGLLMYAAMLNGPTEIALTFCDHFDSGMRGVSSKKDLTKKVRTLMERVEKACQAPVKYVDTGKFLENIIVI